MREKPFDPRVRRRRRDRGFGLIEALCAAFLLAVAAGALIRALSGAALSGHRSARADLAARAANARLASLLSAPMFQPWPMPGYSDSLAPGGSVDAFGPAAPGYAEFVGEDGEPADAASAVYEVRWAIREVVPRGADRLAIVVIEVVALPVEAGRGPVARVVSARTATDE